MSFVPPVLSSPFVAVSGSRVLPASSVPLVSGVVRSVFASGRGLAVGCAAGADHFALAAALRLLAPSVPAAAGLCARPPAPTATKPQHAQALAADAAHACAASPALAAHLAVFLVSAFPPRNRAAFARRSTALVHAVAASGTGSGLIAFPAGACPVGVVPGRRWRSAKGSGTWGTAALAAGLGLPLVVFFPAGVSLPAAWGGWSPAGSGVWASGSRLMVD